MFSLCVSLRCFLSEYGLSILCYIWGSRNVWGGAGGFISFLTSHFWQFIVVVRLCVDFGFLA